MKFKEYKKQQNLSPSVKCKRALLRLSLYFLGFTVLHFSSPAEVSKQLEFLAVTPTDIYLQYMGSQTVMSTGVKPRKFSQQCKKLRRKEWKKYVSV